MSISAANRAKTVHICTLTPDQQSYEAAISSWFAAHGYHILAHSGDPLPDKLRAARECDMCLLVLGSEFGPPDTRSCFSHTELEVVEALKEHHLFVLVERDVTSLSIEQRDFIRRIKDFKQGWFANNIFSLEAATLKKMTEKEWSDRLDQVLTKIIASWRPPSVEVNKKVRPQVLPDAIMICSTGMIRDERVVVRNLLLEQKPVPAIIDYTQAGAEPVTPRSWVIENVRQCRAVFLIMGPDYGKDIPFEGLGATELEFEHALNAGVPVFAFLRSDAPLAPHNLRDADPNQADFVERVQKYLPDGHLFFFDKVEAEAKLERRIKLKKLLELHIKAALHRLENLPLPLQLRVVDEDVRQRWYRRRVHRWLGTLPHLMHKQGVLLEHVYVTLQTLPQQAVRREQDAKQVFVPERDQKEEEEERRQIQTLTVDAALKQFPRLVLQGNPGSGKSVALHWYALMAGEQVTPVFIALVSYARAVEEAQVTSLEDFITREERRFLLAEAGTPSLWLKRLREGHGLLLLDALDEVPLTQQERVLTDVLAFSQTLFTNEARDSRIVLTTRIAGFRRERLDGFFTITEVQYLTPAQQRQLIRYWYRISSLDRPEMIGERTNRIVDVLQRQASLNSWARTPLMLTLLTTLAAVMDIDFSTRFLTKADVYRLSIRLMLSQWSTLSDRDRNRIQYGLWQKEGLLLALAWQNTRGQRRELMTKDDVSHAEAELPPDACLHVSVDAHELLTELSRVDGIFTAIGEAYTFYHPTFQEYLVAKRLASLSEGERQAILEQHRLNEQWEEITQLLVSELDRSGQPTTADAVVETLIVADEQPVFPHSWCDPLHLSLARAARCQGVRASEQALGVVSKIIAQEWGQILEGTLSNFGQQQYKREQACQAILDMGVASKHAYPYVQKLLRKWRKANDRLDVHQGIFFPHLSATAVEALGNIQTAEATKDLYTLLGRKDGFDVHAAVLKALIRLGPDAALPVRDALKRYIGDQVALGAKATYGIGELAAMLLLQLSPTMEELRSIADLGAAWELEAIWATLSLDPVLVMPFLREMMDKYSIGFFLDPTRSRLDYSADPNCAVHTEALEVAHRFGLAAEPLLDLILFRAICDVERNQHLAEEVFVAFGTRAIPVLKEFFFQTVKNETLHKMFFQDVLHGFADVHDEDTIKRLLAEGIRQYRALEKFLDQRKAPDRQQEVDKKRQKEKKEKKDFHRFLAHPPTGDENPNFFRFIHYVEDYGTEAVEFLDELCALAENESLDRDSRIRALIQIEKLGPLAGSKCETICKLLYNPHYSSWAFKVLLAMKSAAAPALPHLQRLLHHKNWVVCAHAIEVIGNLGPSATEVLPDLIALVRDRENLEQGRGMVRQTVVEAFGNLWPFTEAYLDEVCNTLLYDPYAKARSTAAKVLEQIKTNDPRVVEALYTASYCSSASQYINIQGAAVQALRATLAKIDIAPTALSSVAPPAVADQGAQASLELLQEREYIENMLELHSPEVFESMPIRAYWKKKSKNSILKRFWIWFTAVMQK